MTTPDEIRDGVRKWIALCNDNSQTILNAPYIDVPLPKLQESSPIESDTRSPEEVRYFQEALEQHLLQEPTNRILRFAALYPLRAGGLANPYDSQLWLKDCVAAFRHLSGLCLPEKLNSIYDLKFELHNSYLAANWEKADEILRRVALLSLLPASDIHILSGHFWFLSVFGRQIEFELTQDIGDYEFYWPLSLPVFGSHGLSLRTGEWNERSLSRWREQKSFSLPEPIHSGSLAHWILTAWCTNPRAPKPRLVPPEQLKYHELNSPENADPEMTVGVGINTLRDYVHNRYRDFEPLAPQQLSLAQRERLVKAVSDLELARSSNSSAFLPYLPLLARSFYSLHQFERAATAYAALRDSKRVFKDPDDGNIDEDFNWEMWFHLALCYRFRGDHQHAIATLIDFMNLPQRAASEDLQSMARPEGISWWIGRWYSEQGSYQEAASYLRSELKAKLAPPESWQLSTILALGTVLDEQDAAATVRKYISTRSDIQVLLASATLQLWPTFAQLQDESRLHWLAATYLSCAEFPLQDARQALFSNAVREYGWVLEHELRTLIFEPFRNEINGDKTKRAQAIADSRQYDDKFYKLLVRKFDFDMGLGGMIAALKQCNASVVPTDLALLSFLQHHFPLLLTALPAMKTATDLRNKATHKNPQFTAEDALLMSRKCQVALDSLLGRLQS